MQRREPRLETRDRSTRRDDRGVHRRRLEHRAPDVGDERGGDEVEHDRVDDLVRPEPGLEDPRDRAPHRARAGGGEERHGHEGQAREARAVRGHQGGGEAPQVELALGADVEEAGAEGEGDGKAGEDERRGAKQRLPEPVAGSKAFPEHRAVDLERTLPDRDDEERARGQGERHGQERCHTRRERSSEPRQARRGGQGPRLGRPVHEPVAVTSPRGGEGYEFSRGTMLTRSRAAQGKSSILFWVPQERGRRLR